MTRFYLKNKRTFLNQEDLKEDILKDIIWIDMLSPSRDDIIYVEENFDIIFPTKQESEEIEISSRYWEEDNKIEINSYFLVANEGIAKNETVSFILQGKLLISIRYIIFLSLL